MTIFNSPSALHGFRTELGQGMHARERRASARSCDRFATAQPLLQHLTHGANDFGPANFSLPALRPTCPVMTIPLRGKGDRSGRCGRPNKTTKGRIIPLFARDRLVCNVQMKMLGLAKSVRHEHIPAREDPLTGAFFFSASLAIEDGENPFPKF